MKLNLGKYENCDLPIEEIYNSAMGDLQIISELDVKHADDFKILFEGKLKNLKQPYHDELFSLPTLTGDWENLVFCEVLIIKKENQYPHWVLSEKTNVVTIAANKRGFKNFVSTGKEKDLMEPIQWNMYTCGTFGFPMSREGIDLLYVKSIEKTIKDLKMLNDIIANKTIADNIHKIIDLSSQRDSLIDKTVKNIEKIIKISEDF